MTTWTPTRYPAEHPQAGRIIVDPEDDALAEMDAMAGAPTEPATQPTPATVDPTAQRPLSALLPGAEQAPDAPPAQRQGVTAAAALVSFGVVLVAIWAVGRPLTTPTGQAAPTAVPTAPATPAATSAPTTTALPPDAAPRALVGWFDYQDASTAVAVERGERYTVLGRAGTRYLLIETAAGARVWALAEDLDIVADPALPDLAPPAPLPPARPAPSTGGTAPAAAASCTEATAPFRATVTVPPGPRPGDVGGYAVAWSCASQADAQAKAESSAAAIRAKWSTP